MKLSMFVSCDYRYRVFLDIKSVPVMYGKERAWFYNKTRGTTIIVDGKTWNAMNEEPLLRRNTIVVTPRARSFSKRDSVIFCLGLGEAFSTAESSGAKECSILYGPSIYPNAISACSDLYLTRYYDSPSNDGGPQFDIKDLRNKWNGNMTNHLEDLGDINLDRYTIMRYHNDNHKN